MQNEMTDSKDMSLIERSLALRRISDTIASEEKYGRPCYCPFNL